MRVVAVLGVLFPAVALAQQGPTVVDVARVERRAVELTQPLVAHVEPVTMSTLAAELPGLISERSFDEGEMLGKGAVLARMKTDLLQAQLNAAEAARATSDANVAMARAELENANQELDRNRKLIEGNVGSDKEFREAATKARVWDSMVKSRSAEVLEKQAEVQRLKLMIDKSQVVTPVGGVIAKRHVEVGQWVKEGDPVAEIVQLDPLFVRVYVPEAVVARIKRGDEAKVKFDALGGESFTGKIDQIIPKADPNSRTFPVKILLPNPDSKILPGFFGRATITGRQGSALLVPRDAVSTNGGKHQVVAVRAAKAVVVPVTMGSGTGDRVSVTGELTDTDVVVVRGNELLRGGEDLIVKSGMPQTAPSTQQTTAASAK